MNLALDESTQEKVPPLLENILKRTVIDDKSTKSKQTDVFFILIIVLLSENGFLLMTNDTTDLQCWEYIDNKHLSKWKTASGVYGLTIVMDGGFNDILIKLVMCTLETSSLINVVISNIKSEVYSVCFPVSRYVVNPEASTIPMMFHDLKHLSDTFKNKIITPVKSTILNYYGFSGPSLMSLPVELLFDILLTLPVSDIINVAKTCKKLNLLLNNESFWHKLFLRDFSHNVGQTDDPVWKTLYRSIYIAFQESQRKARFFRGSIMDLINDSNVMSLPAFNVI